MSTDVASMQRTLRHALRELEPGRLAEFIAARRWFGGKGRTIELAEIENAAPLPSESSAANPPADQVRVRLADGASALPAALALRPEATERPP